MDFDNKEAEKKMKKKLYDLFFEISEKIEDCGDNVSDIVESMLKIFTIFRSIN